MFAKAAAVQDVADYIFAAEGTHAQFDQSVAQDNACAGGYFAGEIGKGGRDAGGCAGNVTGSNHDGCAAFQDDGFAALQASGADFRALQILKNTDGSVFFFSGCAQSFDVAGVVFMCAVREIKAGDVHAETKHVAHGGFGVAGGG